MNWKKLRALNLDKLTREADSRTLLELFNDVSQVGPQGHEGGEGQRGVMGVRALYLMSRQAADSQG